MGISQQTFYRWKKKYAGLGVAKVRRSKQLEDENRKLQQLAADLRLGKKTLQATVLNMISLTKAARVGR